MGESPIRSIWDNLFIKIHLFACEYKGAILDRGVIITLKRYFKNLQVYVNILKASVKHKYQCFSGNIASW